jgi:hypothetical protein
MSKLINIKYTCSM